MRILLTIAYDGTNYVGWQRQINGVSIQEKIELALSKLYNGGVPVTGASRTDSGVHAKCQKATFDVGVNCFPFEKLPVIINRYLPEDIAVTRAERVPDEFHPRFGAKRKTYRYLIHNANIYDPLCRLTAWHVSRPLDIRLMEQSIGYFIGTHDFNAFCASGSKVKSTVRTIFQMSLSKQDDMICFSVTGDGFLYNMVRIIVGTLHDVGTGRISPLDVESIIKSGVRINAGKTAPPQGLCLHEIIY